MSVYAKTRPLPSLFSIDTINSIITGQPIDLYS
jgi:hypothetical protein